jgi:hypothetical protein
MFSFEIEKLLSKNKITSKHFKYVLPLDSLHKIKIIKNKQHFYIINSKPSNHSGEQ